MLHWKRLQYTFLTGLFLLAASPLTAQTLTKWIDNGPNDQRVNLVFVSEGYTAREQGQFQADADRIAKHFFAEEPLKTYAPYFNVFLLSATSEESGADDPAIAKKVDTRYGATFGLDGIDRLLTVNDRQVMRDVARKLPGYDAIIALVNTPKYGGAGGTVATTSIHPDAAEIAAHELGHSFAGLADEYEYEGQNGFEAPNATAHTHRLLVKWAPWINEDHPVPTPETEEYHQTPGLFEGAATVPWGWYRPHFDSKMKTLGAPWGAVNRQEWILKIYNIVPPFHSVHPNKSTIEATKSNSLTFSVRDVMQPNGHKLNFIWLVNGQHIPEANISAIQFDADELGEGRHTVQVLVEDPTPMVRVDSEDLLRKHFTWTVEVKGRGNHP